MNENLKKLIKVQVTETLNVVNSFSNDKLLLSRIEYAAGCCINAYKRGCKVIFAGNGGSAADAQHFAGELVSKFYFNRPGLPAIALTTDSSILTAIANDFGYERVFARQLQAQGVKGDVFVGISTSGNSKNLVAACGVCKEIGITSIAMTGYSKCEMDNYDVVLKVPSTETPRIQECQTVIGHILCCLIERELFGTFRK